MNDRMIRTGRLLWTAMLMLLIVPSLPAAAQPAGRDQVAPALVDNPDGEQFLMVWAEDQGAGARLFFRRLFGNGRPIGGPQPGSSEATRILPRPGMPSAKGVQQWPALIANAPREEFILVWSEQPTAGVDFDVFAQRLGGNGSAMGVPVVVAGGPGNQLQPDITFSGRRNEFIIVWSEDTRDAGDILGQRMAMNLVLRGAPFAVVQGPGAATDPSIVQDFLTDDILVAWADDRAGTNTDIWARRINENGLPLAGPLGGQFPLVQSSQDDLAPDLHRGPPPSEEDATPRDRSVRNLMTWTSHSVTAGLDVRGVRLSSSGLAVGPSFVVAGGPNDQAFSSAAFDVGRDGWLVAFNDNSSGDQNILALRVALSGIARRPAFAVVAD